MILYAPTWRDNQHDSSIGYSYRLGVDFQRLREALAEEYVLLFRAHYLVASHFDFAAYQGFVYDVDVYKRQEYVVNARETVEFGLAVYPAYTGCLMHN